MIKKEDFIEEIINIIITNLNNKKNRHILDKKIIEPTIETVLKKTRPYLILLTIFIMSMLSLIVSVIILLTSWPEKV